MAIIFQNEVLSISIIETSTGLRKLYVTATDGNEGFQCRWPRGLSASYIRSRDIIMFSNFRGKAGGTNGSRISTTIQVSMFQSVKHIYETVDRFLKDLFQEIDILYDVNIKKTRGPELEKELPYVKVPDREDKVYGYSPKTKKNKYICLANSGDRVRLSREFSAEQVAWVKSHAVNEVTIRESLHKWVMEDDKDIAC